MPGAASRMWQASATSIPPPAATPWMAATTGFGDASISSRIAGRDAAPGGGGALNSRISAPPQNIRSAPAMTIAATASSASASATRAPSAARMAKLRPLTGGLVRRSRATSSWSSNVTEPGMRYLPALLRRACDPGDAGATQGIVLAAAGAATDPDAGSRRDWDDSGATGE